MHGSALDLALAPVRSDHFTSTRVPVLPAGKALSPIVQLGSVGWPQIATVRYIHVSAKIENLNVYFSPELYDRQLGTTTLNK